MALKKGPVKPAREAKPPLEVQRKQPRIGPTIVFPRAPPQRSK